jgi:ABC-2 type transport system permease protein
MRDLRSEMSYRVSFFLQFFNVFTSVAVFYFLARLFGEAAVPYLEPYGGDYFSFVLIGIAFGGYFGVGLSGFSNGLRRAQTTGTLEAMLSTPTSLSAIIINASLWSYLITTLRVVIYLLIGGLFLGVDLSTGNYGAAFIILILTVVSFSSLGILAASFIMVLKRGNPITWIFGTTANLLGGVYYPVDVMPAWMQTLAKLLPVTYALRAMRMALLHGVRVTDLRVEIVVLLGFCVLLLPMSLVAFRWAVAKARLDGSLTHY